MVKILLAEDDKAMNALVATYLRDCGYEIKCCYDGETALDAFATGSYAMVISDIMMPKADGFELARGVRALNASVPILFMSAKDDKPSKMLGYRLGIDD